MQKIILSILLIISFVSCSDSDKKVHQKYTLLIRNGEGWSESVIPIECDSFQMVSKSEAYYYDYSEKHHVFADRIVPYKN